jgi:succinate-semialdehyde dehydrogenase
MNAIIPENKKNRPPQFIEMVLNTYKALRIFDLFSQKNIDSIVRSERGKYVYDNAGILAQIAIENSGIGNLQGKIQKCRSKIAIILNNLKGKKNRVSIPVITAPCNIVFAPNLGNSIVIALRPIKLIEV